MTDGTQGNVGGERTKERCIGVMPPQGQAPASAMQAKRGPGEPGPYRGEGTDTEIGGPFDGLRARKNCYNRAQLAGVGRSGGI